jgi:hypothetical protein
VKVENQVPSFDNQESMSSQGFLLLNIVGALGIILLFMLGRKSVQNPAKLDLKLVPKNALVGPDDLYFHFGPESFPKTRNLNIRFMYNGNDFDAYEVLGVPPGCSLERIRFGFERRLRESGPESHAFFHAAYKAIIENFYQSQAV